MESFRFSLDYFSYTPYFKKGSTELNLCCVHVQTATSFSAQNKKTGDKLGTIRKVTENDMHMYNSFYLEATALAYYNCWLS